MEPSGTIFNTQPGDAGSGEGFSEEFDVNIIGLVDPAFGVHFDLFTVEGDGTYSPGDAENKMLVEAFAPFLTRRGVHP